MDFIADNYIWFIVGGIIVVMTIIGYFAEKTDFGKRSERIEKVPKEPKVTKEDKKRQKAEKVALEKAQKEAEALAKAEEAAKAVPEVEIKVPDVSLEPGVAEDLNAPFGDKPVDVDNAALEDLTVPLPSSESEVVTEEPVVISDALEDLYAPLEDKKEGDDLPLPEIDSLESSEVEAPNADTLEIEKKDTPEEDVWKF